MVAETIKGPFIRDPRVQDNIKNDLLKIVHRHKILSFLDKDLKNKGLYKIYGMKKNLNELKQIKKELKTFISETLRNDTHLLLKYQLLNAEERYYYFLYLREYKGIEEILS